MTQEQFQSIEKRLKDIEDHVSEMRQIHNVDFKTKLDSILSKMESYKDEIIKELREDITGLSH